MCKLRDSSYYSFVSTFYKKIGVQRQFCVLWCTEMERYVHNQINNILQHINKEFNAV